MSRLILLTIGMALILAFAGGLYQYSRKMIRAIEGPGVSAPAWDLFKVKKKMEESALYFEDARRLLVDYDFFKAHSVVSVNSLEPIRDYLKWYPTNAVRTGLTLRGWVDARNDDYLAQVKEQFTNAIHRLKSGQLNPNRIQDAMNIHSNDPFFKTAYGEKIGAIRTARMALAPKALRVHIRGAEEERALEKLIEEKIRAKLDSETNLFLFIGEPMSEEERMATGRTLLVDVKVEYATYKIRKYSSFSHSEWKPTRIPGFAQLAFSYSGAEGMMSSWDALVTIKVYLEPPRVISLKTEAKYIDAYYTALLEDVGKKLDTFPPFNQSETPKDFLPQ